MQGFFPQNLCYCVENSENKTLEITHDFVYYKNTIGGNWHENMKIHKTISNCKIIT